MQNVTYSVPCKHCGRKFKYSGRSRAETLEYGFSAPEYCEDCQKEDKKSRANMGSPYFNVTNVEGELIPGELGIVEHPMREHIATLNEGSFDPTKFGLTPQKVVELADWFSDPDHRVAIVEGPTGSGKSTALPYWLVYPPEGIDPKFFTRNGMILVTQPRINAVEGPSGFVGEVLMGSEVGKGSDVGLSHSDVDKTDWRNALCYTTDGKLVNLAAKGRLGQFGIIVVDEAHERSENIEQIMAVLRERLDLYPHLKLIIASATIDTETFLNHFQNHGAKLFSFEGKERVDKHGNPVSYIVEHSSEQDALPYDDPDLLRKKLVKGVLDKAKWLITEIAEGRGEMGIGDVLIFMHSTKVIDKMVTELRSWVKSNKSLNKIVEIYPLYSALDKKDQDKATLGELPDGKFRVIISTNYAEASVTIDTLSYEIETGVMILTQFNSKTNKTEYPTDMIGKDNARQRWGRTGRTRNGLVYTTYSERQFHEFFPDFQIPALERVNMESSLLASKEAGIVNPETVWLAKVNENEISRAHEELVSTGALDKDGSLTEYGMLLRHMSYPTRIIDLLLSADDIGCLVEMATILPVIMNDNKHRGSILKTNKNWDVYTKYQAYRRHSALMAGCVDDIEFILKLFKAWDELPWLDQEQLQKLGKNQSEQKDLMDQLRKQWAGIHYINHETMVEIRKERDSVLQQFNIGMKTEKFRTIELMFHGRVIDILVKLLGSKSLKQASNPYLFDGQFEPEDETIITCFASKPVISDQSSNFSRLFAEQVYPVGFRFLARVKDERGKIVTFRNLTRSEELKEQYTNFVEDQDSYDEEDEETTGEVAFDIDINSLGVQYLSINCLQFVENIEQIDGNTIEVEIVRHEYQGKKTIIYSRAIPKPSPFELFVQRYRQSDEIQVEVIEHFQLARDFQISIHAREVETGFQILIAPDDLSFSRDSSITQKISRGMLLNLNIENINPDLQRVRASNWESVEKIITDELESSERHDSSAIVVGNIVSIYDDGKIMLLLDNSDLDKGAIILTRIFPEKLPKPFREYSLGERMAVRIERRSRKTAFATLRELPDKAKNQIPNTEIDGLFYSNGQLNHKGAMSYEDLYEYKTISDETEYINALERIYWFSNQINVAELVDIEVYEKGMARSPQGSFIHGATITELTDKGAFIQIGQNELGFVFKANVLGAVKKNSFSALKVGSQVNVRVKSFNTQYSIPELEILDFTDEKDDPLNHLEIGSIVDAMITSVNDDEGYIYLKLESGITGRVHFNQMYIDTRKIALSEIYRENMSINVKVHNISKQARLVDFDMKIPEHDPLSVYKTGEKYKGVVREIKNFGIIVDIGYNIQGLVHVSRMHVPKGKSLQSIFKVDEEVLVMLTDKIERTKVELSMRIPEYEYMDPENNLKVGLKIEGEVESVKTFGYLINIAEGVKGLLRIVDIPEVQTGFLGFGGMKKPTLSKGMKVEVVIKDISPSKKIPNKTDYNLGFVKIV